MDISQFTAEQLLLAIGAGCFVLGVLGGRIAIGGRGRNSSHEDPRNHRIRDLEADQRACRKQLAELEKSLEQKTVEFNTAVATLQELRTTIAGRDNKISVLEKDLRASIVKTNDLRRELQERAAETVREQVRAEEAVTELQVERAGSEAVMTEIVRLQQERQRLSETMQKLSGSLLMDEELFGPENS